MIIKMDPINRKAPGETTEEFCFELFPEEGWFLLETCCVYETPVPGTEILVLSPDLELTETPPCFPPTLTPTLFFVLIISLINSFQLFTQIMIMTPDGGPLGSTMVMVERIYKCGFRYYEMGTAAAYSWILFAILLLLTMVQMKLQNKWVNYDD